MELLGGQSPRGACGGFGPREVCTALTFLFQEDDLGRCRLAGGIVG